LALQQAFAPIVRAGAPLLTMLAGALGRVAQAAAPVVITIGQVIGSLAQGLAPVIGNLLNVIGGAVSRVLGALGVARPQAALWLWNNAIKPAFTFIGTLARWLYSVIVVAVVGPIMVQFKIWAAVAKWLYGSVISPVFRGIGTVIRWAYNTLIRPVFNAFATV